MKPKRTAKQSYPITRLICQYTDGSRIERISYSATEAEYKITVGGVVLPAKTHWEAESVRGAALLEQKVA